MLDKNIIDSYLAMLEEELIPAMGCTEPIALAYAAARGADVLGCEPESIAAHCSGNIIKNVRCVRIPNSGGMIGIEAACAMGAICGNADRVMEVLESVTPEGLRKVHAFLENNSCRVEFLESPIPLHFVIELVGGGSTVLVEVRHAHTNIAKIVKNGEIVYKNDSADAEVPAAKEVEITIENIYAFANEVELDRVKPMLSRQIECNMAIAAEGLKGNYGINIGKAIRDAYPDSLITRIRSWAAAGSEARMDGCDMPVIINSGSGNQGIASSVPVIVYARETDASEEQLYRALAFSGMMTVYQKKYIGKLSAFCGAVSASCASGAAITYMAGGSIQQIKDTVDNALADVSGIVCDGAKASCAIKIASSLDAAMLAHTLAMQGRVYTANSGILGGDANETISSVGYIGKVGMKQTDSEIVKMMIKE